MMDAFNAAAFCILMDHHRDGVERAHPDYIKEKLQEFQLSQAHAVACLDWRNQARLRDWVKHWNYPVDEELENWLEQKEQFA